MKELETVIVGTRFRGENAIRASARLAVGQEIRLQRDAANPYDANAVACFAFGMQIGFLSKLVNAPIAAAMDSGSDATATVIAPAEITGKLYIKREAKIRVNLE